MGALREKMIRVMEVRRFAIRTQEAYLSAVTGITKYYGRSPAELTDRDVEAYLHHLLIDKEKAWASVNQICAGIRFLFIHTLGHDREDIKIPPRRGEQRLPEILSREEVDLLISHATSARNHAVLMTTYAAGLRLGEVIRLKLTDIDSDRNMLRIEQAKRREASTTSGGAP